MSSRSRLLPLLAVLASTVTAMADGDVKLEAVNDKGRNLNRNSPLAFAHTLIGAQPVQFVADNKKIFGKIKYGKSTKPKRISAEGYTIDVIGKKLAVPYLDDFVMSVQLGRQYAFALMGDVDTVTSPPVPLVVDMANIVIPKTEAHVVVGNASPDAPPVDVFINGILMDELIESGDNGQMLVLPAGKHVVEVYEGLDRRISKKMKLKGKRTHVFFYAGTSQIGDNKPLRLIISQFKGRRK